MGRQIEISNSDKSLRAIIDPYTGAMMTHVFVDGRACLRYYYDKTAVGVTEAGGNPVLFPFPSSTSADGYVVDGKTYYMPFHGLVMNTVFKVEEKSKSRVLLSITNSGLSTRLKVKYFITILQSRIFQISRCLIITERIHISWHQIRSILRLSSTARLIWDRTDSRQP